MTIAVDLGCKATKQNIENFVDAHQVASLEVEAI